MKKSPDKQLSEVLTWLSKSKISIPELDLIKKFGLDSTWYAQTFRGDGLVNSIYDNQNNKHMVTLSVKGVSLLSSLTKPRYEKPFGLVVIGVIIAIMSLVIEKKWDFFSAIFNNLFS